jgi:O-antigen/teichoic acid export membrane protein
MEPLSQASTAHSAADGAVPTLGDQAPASPSVSAFLRSYLTPAGKQAIWNLGWLVAGTVVSQACGLIGVLLLTRALGPEQFGIYTFSMTLYGYLALAAAAGMGPVVIREVTRRPHDLRAITAAYIAVSLSASVLITAVTWLGVYMAAPSPDERFLLACIVLANLANCVQLLPFLDAHHRQSLLAMVTSVVDIGWLSAMLACFATGSLTLRLASVLIAVRIIALAAGSLAVYRLVIAPIDVRVRWREVSGLLASSWSLLITQLAATIPLTSGVLLVRWFHGEAAAGIMGLATLVLQTFLQLTVVAIRIVYPHITGPHGNEPTFRRKLWIFFLGYQFVLFAAIVLAVWGMVTWLLPTHYARVLQISLLILCGGIVQGTVWLYFQFMIAGGRELTVVLTQLISSALFLACALPAAYCWSVPGAAASFSLSAFFMLIILIASRQMKDPIGTILPMLTR